MTPARVASELRALADRMPTGVRLGTSSWSFPGWAGILYGTRETDTRLARDGLAVYASHPLLGAVGIDRTFYAPIDAATFAGYAAVVPERFRFLVKAHEACTLARFPRHPRYGASAGETNPFFLDASYATDAVIGPCLEGLGAKAGPILFQLPPQARSELGCREAAKSRREAYVVINNKAEGSAPLPAFRLAAEIAGSEPA